MHRAPPVDVSLGPSRRAAAWIVGLALATLMLVAALPGEGWIRVAATLVIAGWATRALWRDALRRHAGAIRRLRVEGNLTVHAVTQGGRTLRGRVLDATYVGAHLTTLVWRADGSRFARSECLLQDTLPAHAFRRLRVQLRYGRSEVTDGAPRSHA
jgi:hypothetical protein